MSWKDDGREQVVVVATDREKEEEEDDDAKVAAAVAHRSGQGIAYINADDEDDDDVSIDVEDHHHHHRQSSVDDESERKPQARGASDTSSSPSSSPQATSVTDDEKALYREQLNMARDIVTQYSRSRQHASATATSTSSPHASPKLTAVMTSVPSTPTQEQQQQQQQQLPGAVAVPAYVTSRQSAKAMAAANGGSFSSLFAGAVSVPGPAPNSTMAWGSHITHYNNTYGNNNNSNNSNSIITAHVQRSPHTTTSPHRGIILPASAAVVMAAPDLGATAATVVLAATTVEQATPRPTPPLTTRAPKYERRMRYILAALAVCMVALAAVLVGFEVSKHQSSSSSSTTTSVTQFDPYTTDCSLLAQQQHPHVVTQCLCQGSISKLPNDVVAHYQSLSTSFYPTLYPNAITTTTNTTTISMYSCSPQNQALLWLASGDGIPPATGDNTDASSSSLTKLRQRYLLTLFFIIWNGPTYWQVQHGWLTLDDECGWTGIVCGSGDDSNNVIVVTEIALSNVNFQHGFIPSEIGLMTTLKSLLLASTHLNGTLPPELFDGLSDSLQVLDVTGNAIAGTIPNVLGNLVHLERLMLSSNVLTGTIPQEIGNCTNLQQVIVDFNYLNGTIPSQMNSLPNIKWVCFIGNFFTGPVPDRLQGDANCATGGNTWAGM